MHLFNNLIEIGDATTSIGVQVVAASVNAVNNTIITGDGDDVIGIINQFTGQEEGILQYVNNTLTVGSATSDQAAFLFDGVPIPKVGLFNNNLYIPSKFSGCLVYDGTTCVTTLNDVHDCEWVGCYMADGNLDEGPGFVSPATGDYHLKATSPLIDAGVNPLPLIRPELSDWIWYDSEGNPRPAGDGWDIGAYEYSAE